MTKDAFESIMRGAREAIAYVEGNKADSRTDGSPSSQPISAPCAPG
jgi:hypothetical protein